MRAVVLTTGLCCLVLIGCGSSKPQDLIVGKWEMVAQDVKPGEVVDEFTRDGKVIGYRDGKKFNERKYSLADDGKLEFKEDDGKTFATYKATVTKDEMTQTGGDGQVTKFKRVK